MNIPRLNKKSSLKEESISKQASNILPNSRILQCIRGINQQVFWELFLQIIVFVTILIERQLLNYYFPEKFHFHTKLLYVALLGEILPIEIFLFVASCIRNKYRKIFYFFAELSFFICIILNAANILMLYHTKSILTFEWLKMMQPFVYPCIISSPVKWKITGIFVCLAFSFLVLLIHKIIKKTYITQNKHNFSLFIFLIRLFILINCILALVGYVHYSKTNHKGLFRSEWLFRPAYINLSEWITDGLTEQSISFEKYGSAKKNLSKESYNLLCQKGFFVSHEKIKYSEDFDNIILVALESFDLRYLHRYNPDIPEYLTEKIEKIMDSNVSFSNFYTADMPTEKGHYSLLTSRFNATFKVQVPSLFSEFKKNGWETFLLCAVPQAYGKDKKNYDMLYAPDHSFYAEYFEKKNKTLSSYWGRRSKDLYDEAARIIQQKSQKHFIFIATIDSHPPYRTAAQYSPLKEQQISADSEENTFFHALATVNFELFEFYQKIKAFSPKTLLIITADHSATHGYFAQKRKDIRPDRIPLILAGFNLKLIQKEQTNYCSQIDLAPFLLELAGIDIPETFMGSNLLKKQKAISYWEKNLIIRDSISEKIIPLTEDSLETKWFKAFYVPEK